MQAIMSWEHFLCSMISLFVIILKPFTNVVINYPTYYKELYSLVQSMKKWEHYFMGKEMIIHTNHQPLQYLQSQTKLQQARHFRWMRFL